VRLEDVVTDDTVPLFGANEAPRAEPSGTGGGPRTTTCPACGSRFSPEGRFCPFDGTALVQTAGWHPSADELLGTVVDGRYELLRVLGEGGMGTVYEARHRALGKRFALKALRRDLAQDPEIAARFIQEARTAAAVSHPGLVEITDFGGVGSTQVYFVMELLEGTSLAALLRGGGPLPAARGLAIVRQLAHALKAAHDASIVHRDLKPDNIYVCRGDGDADWIKVVDFGLAKVIGSSKITRAGVVFGTPHYMSPEQASGDVVDHRSDIYALGVVMYEMFTGQVPFEADSYMGVLTKHLYMTPAPPSALRPELGELGALERVILRCLQKRPEARYDDLGELLRELNERLPSSPSQGEPGPVRSLLDQVELPSERGLPPPRRHGGKALGLALVLAVAVAAAVMALALSRRGRLDERAGTSELRAASPLSAAPREVVTAATPPEPSRPASSLVAPPLASAPSRPARKPASGARTAAPSRASAAPKPPSARRPGAGAGDIVDPWAR
jgi:eukaryotic-like serine/threonine-protein kinase